MGGAGGWSSWLLSPFWIWSPSTKTDLTVSLLLVVVETNAIAGSQERSPHVIRMFKERWSMQGRLGRGEFQELRIWSYPEQPPGIRTLGTMVGGLEP